MAKPNRQQTASRPRSARWVEVRLVFSAPVRAQSANTWVVFLCTNVQRSEVNILEVYEIRDRESGRLQTLTYAALLWQLFRALIEGALDGLIRDLGKKVVKKVLAAIDQTVEEFRSEALQISPQQISVQLKAEELG